MLTTQVYAKIIMNTSIDFHGCISLLFLFIINSVPINVRFDLSIISLGGVWNFVPTRQGKKECNRFIVSFNSILYIIHFELMQYGTYLPMHTNSCQIYRKVNHVMHQKIGFQHWVQCRYQDDFMCLFVRQFIYLIVISYTHFKCSKIGW